MAIPEAGKIRQKSENIVLVAGKGILDSKYIVLLPGIYISNLEYIVLVAGKGILDSKHIVLVAGTYISGSKYAVLLPGTYISNSEWVVLVFGQDKGLVRSAGAIAFLLDRDHTAILQGVCYIEMLLKIGDAYIKQIYKQSEELFNMSKMNSMLEICPNERAPYPHRERFSSGLHRCPVCNGRKEFTRQTGYDEYDNKPCEYCRGEGFVRAMITVEWEPAANNNNDMRDTV